MARIRSIHPGIFTDEAFMELTVEAPLAIPLLLGLWTEADDQGVFQARALTLKARLLPAVAVSVEPLLAELERRNFIRRFTSEGREYGAVRNFQRYQRPKKPKITHPIPTDLLSYVGRNTTGSELADDEGGDEEEPGDDQVGGVPHQFPTGGENCSQREEGGGRKKERASLSSSGDDAPAPSEGFETAPPAPETSAEAPNPVAAAVEAWNAICGPALGAVRKVTDGRRRAIAARLREDFAEDPAQWAAYLRRIVASTFLTGGGGRDWRANLDWAVKPGSVVQVLEGKYDDRGGAAARQKPAQALDERYWDRPPSAVRQLPKPTLKTPERLAWDEAHHNRSAPHPVTRKGYSAA